MTSPRRRWFSFSLRSFFLGVAVVGVGIGYVAHQERVISERSEVIEMVGDYGLDIWWALADDRELHTHYANAYRRWKNDAPLARAIWLPEGNLSDDELQQVRHAFPEASVETYRMDLRSSAKFRGRAVFAFSDSLEAVGLGPSDSE